MVKGIPTTTADNPNIIFGDIGNYDATYNEYTKGMHDGIITYQDIDFIEDYYYKKTNSPGSITEQETQFMIKAGFGDPCGDLATHPDSQQVQIPYTSWLEIPYERTTTSGEDWGNETDYEVMMNFLYLKMQRSYIGDGTLDGKCNTTDVNALTQLLKNTEDEEGRRTYKGQIQYLRTHRYDAQNNIYVTTDPYTYTQARQVYLNLCLYYPVTTTSSPALNDNDLLVVKAIQDNIFGIIKYPTDVSVFTGNPAELQVTAKSPDSTNFEFVWTYYDGEQYVTIHNDSTYTIETVEQEGNIRMSTLKIAKADIKMNNRIYRVSIYLNRGTDSEKAKTYSCRLYVDTPELLGDVVKNGFVNVIDAYKVLNKFLYKKGDMNRDNRVDAGDAGDTLRWYATVSTLPPDQLDIALKLFQESMSYPVNMDDINRCDINEDGRVDAGDASNILTLYSLLSTEGEQYAEEYMRTNGFPNFRFIPESIIPTTEGELAALLTVDGQRQTAYTKYSGEQILESIKNNDVQLR